MRSFSARVHCKLESAHTEESYIIEKSNGTKKILESFEEILQYTHLLRIKDTNLYHEYRHDQKSSIYWPTFLMGLLFFIMITVTRCSIMNLFQLGLYFNISQSILVLLGAVTLLYFPSLIFLVFSNKSSRSYKFASYLVFTFANGHIEDLIIILGAQVAGFFLLARVMAGSCVTNENVFNQQSCNPKSELNSLPNDSVLLIQLIPVVVPIIMRGISRWGVLISSLIAVAFLITCEVLVSGVADMWTISYTSFCLLTSYETQRTKLTNFLQNKANLLQQALMVEREVEHQRQVAEILRKSSEFEKEQLGCICANVAHDLKTPIQSIAMGIESIKSNFLIPAYKDGNLRSSCCVSMEASPLLDVLSASCTFMTMAVNRAIDFTKASGNVTLKPTMSIFNVANDMMLPISCIKCLQSDVNIVTDVQSDVLANSAVVSDQNWFCENILCLLSNAVKFSDGGMVNVVIELQKDPFKLPPAPDSSNNDSDHDYPDTLYSLHDHPVPPSVQQYVIVSVHDCGIGIPSEIMDSLFKPHSQTDRLAGGAGLGLYSLQHRVAALGGQCGVLNRTDGSQGSVFWFSFPYKVGIRISQSSSASTMSAVPNHSFFHPMRRLSVRRNSKDILSPAQISKSSPSSLRILLVDDSLPILKMIQAALEKLGHQVFTAKNGARGLAEMQRLALQPREDSSTGLDLVLMDIQMPVMDGIEATRRFRELEALSVTFDDCSPWIPSTRKSDVSIGSLHDAESLCFNAAASAAFAYMRVTDLSGSAGGFVSIRSSVGGGKYRHLPIIGMSANSDPSTKSMALAAGMDNFMPKPFSLKEFEFVVQQLRLR